MSATTQFTPITIGSSNSNGKAQNQGTNLGERIDCTAVSLHKWLESGKWRVESGNRKQKTKNL